MLEADSHNIFGSGGGARDATMLIPGPVTYERPTDGTPYFSRDIMGGVDTPTEYVLLVEVPIINTEGGAVDVTSQLHEQYLSSQQQRTGEITEAAARIGLNAQLTTA
jgi:hypothetical protein